MRNDGVQLRIGDLIYAVRKRWTLIVFLTLLGLGFGILMSGVSYLQGSMSRNYEIKSSVVLISQNPDGNFASHGTETPAIDDFRMAQEMTDTAMYIIRSERTLNGALSRLDLIGITAKDISDNLAVNQYNETPVIEMILTWRSAAEGIAILNAVLAASTESLRETLRGGAVSVIDEPAARYLVAGAMNVPIWGIMVVLGFGAGVGIAVLDLLMRPTLLNLKDIQTNFGLETLGIIPRDESYFRKKKSLLVDNDEVRSVIEQRYSAAAYIIRNRLGTKEGHHSFFVTSTAYGEGKTSVAANLAIQLSDMEHKVLLIDFDIKNPGLGGLFLGNVDYEHSLNALYKGEINEVEAITTLTGYLDLLPTVLERNAMPIDGTVVELINRIAKNYEYVIMDAPPVGQVSDALSLNTVADTALLVIGYDFATQADIQASIERLDKSGIRVLGCIVNRDHSVYSHGFLENDQENRGRIMFRKNARKAVAAGGRSESDESVLTVGGRRKGARVKKKKIRRSGGLFGRRRSSDDSVDNGQKNADASEDNMAKDSQADRPADQKTPDETAEKKEVSRNILSETALDDSYFSRRTDSDITEELVKMGMEGNWNKGDHQE